MKTQIDKPNKARQKQALIDMMRGDEEIGLYDEVQNPTLCKGVGNSVSVEDALAFAEYFRNNFDYCDCNANGRVYKWIDLEKRDQSAMTMKQIFEYWLSHNN